MNGQPELRLLLEQHQTLEQPRPSVGLAGTVAVHLLLAGFAAILPAPEITRVAVPRVVTELRHTPLVAPPPRQLTQRDPNTGRVRQEVNLQGLLARRSPVPAPPAPPAPTRPAAPQTVQAPPTPSPVVPTPKPAAEPPSAVQPPPEPPPVTEVARNVPPAGTPDPAPQAPPQIQTVEKPKLAFENPGSQIGTPSGSGAGTRKAIDVPRPASIQEAARTVARGGGGGGVVVGDVGAVGSGGLGEALSGAPGQRQASSLELLSDPEGIDFKPYLIQILSTIRRNWLAVLPESARLGRKGRVQIQFAVDRSGGIPKLVIALPSGTEALDRAAVAGISASNPLPPLPPGFKGEQVRLQFTFLYNIPAR